MNAASSLLVVLLAGSSPPAADLAGAWSGTVEHDGEKAPFALELEPGDDGKVLVKMSFPLTHLRSSPIGRAPLKVDGRDVRLGPFAFTYDAEARTLSGVLPEALVPVYRMAVTLRHVDRLEPAPPRPEIAAPVAKPVWTFDAGAPLWAGATFAEGLVLAGDDKGRLHGLDPRTGRERWSFQAGGPVRSRVTADAGDVFFQADDGFAYRLAAASGEERWRVRVVEKAIVRLPLDDPGSRFDTSGSGVTPAGERLYLGTHDGRVVALDRERGARIWEFASGASVLGRPAVDSGRVYFGSFDGFVYALDAARGQLVWKRETHGAVVSTPAVDGDRVVVGNRAYDLLGLDAATGQPAWKRYIWGSWVESSAALRDGVAYVGSSDAAALFAFDVRSGRPLWRLDVRGWAWGEPAVTDRRVFVGVAATAGYMVEHRGGMVAVDRATGRPAWHYEPEPRPTGASGFPGSAAVGSGLVFVAGVDGRVYAFTQ
jgi:outer membrane protein assembly factor BamB